MPELDQMNPEMEPQNSPELGGAPDMGAEPAMNGMPVDHEGAMAKADLYKLANYSFKLFKQIDDGQQLEAWVQAKITKAADYIASVYHYLEYEMKFSEYGKALDNSDVLSESQKAELRGKLMEAKDKVKQLKKTQAKKVEEAFDDKAKSGDTKKTKTGVLTKTDTGVVHKRTDFSDEPHTEPKSNAKSRSAAEKAGDKAADKAQEKDYKAAKKANPEGVRRYSLGKQVDEAKGKPDFLDMDKDGDKKEPMKKAIKDKKLKESECSVCHEDPCSCKDVKESAKPSAGLSKGEKSAVVKKAKKGEDIGKPGKSFDKVAKSAGGGEKGKKIAAAAMWKNIKETVKVEEAKKKAKPDFLDMDKDGDKAEPMKKAVADKKEVVKESADMTRMKEFLTRLNG